MGMNQKYDAREVQWQGCLRGMGQPVQGIHHPSTMEQQQASFSAVSVFDRRRKDVLCQAPGME